MKKNISKVKERIGRGLIETKYSKKLENCTILLDRAAERKRCDKNDNGKQKERKMI